MGSNASAQELLFSVKRVSLQVELPCQPLLTVPIHDVVLETASRCNFVQFAWNTRACYEKRIRSNPFYPLDMHAPQYDPTCNSARRQHEQ